MPFKCEWPGCEKAFPLRRRLVLHHSSHIGMKTFKCDWPQCGLTYRLIIFHNAYIYREIIKYFDKQTTHEFVNLNI